MISLNVAAERERFEALAGGGCTSVETIAQLVGSFMAWAARNMTQRRGSCTATNTRDACRQLLWLYADIPPDELTPLRLKAVREVMVSESLSKRTINDRICRVRRVWKWGVENGHVAAPTWEALRAVQALSRPKDQPRPVPWELVAATLPHLPELVQSMVLLQWHTGMRPGEVCAMRPCDLETGSLPWVYRPPEHKNAWRGTTREVYLGRAAVSVLSAIMSRPRAVDAPARAIRSSSAPFDASLNITTSIFPYRQSSYYNAVRRACRREGIEHWSVNQLRHSFATRARKALGLEAAQVLLGHAKTDTTELYARRNDAAAREAVLKLG